MTGVPIVPVTRVCRGPSHDGPTRLPLDAAHWYFRGTASAGGGPNRSGPHRVGDVLSPCRRCTNYRQLSFAWLETTDGPRGWVPLAPVRAYAVELLERCGTYDRVFAEHGVKAATLRTIIKRRADRRGTHVHARTAQRILAALTAQRRHDRIAGVTSERFRRAQAARARAAMQADIQLRRESR